MAVSEKARVRAANEAFYAAFRDGDMAAMDAVWSRRPDVRVFHPNRRGVEGREKVMRSWRGIMRDRPPPEIHASGPVVILCRNSATVICFEELGYARMIATNVFLKEDGVWRMVHHQATRLPVTAGDRARRNAAERDRKPD